MIGDPTESGKGGKRILDYSALPAERGSTVVARLFDFLERQMRRWPEPLYQITMIALFFSFVGMVLTVLAIFAMLVGTFLSLQFGF